MTIRLVALTQATRKSKPVSGRDRPRPVPPSLSYPQSIPTEPVKIEPTILPSPLSPPSLPLPPYEIPEIVSGPFVVEERELSRWERLKAWLMKLKDRIYVR